MEKIEALLRFLALSTLALAAILMGSDSQTVMLLGVVTKKATFTSSQIYVVSMYVNSIIGGYNLAQLVKCLSMKKVSHKIDEFTSSSHLLHWAYFAIDQIAAYIIFAVSSASTQFSMFAITGQEEFQWMKLCKTYRRFCLQIGGSLLCGVIASFLLLVISAISAFKLFRWYSPNFLCLKRKRICVLANNNNAVATTAT